MGADFNGAAGSRSDRRSERPIRKPECAKAGWRNEAYSISLSEAFPSAIGKDGYPATVGAASRRRDFGNRSVVMTAIVKVLPEPPVGLQFAPARFLEEERMKKDLRIAALPVALLSIVLGI